MSEPEPLTEAEIATLHGLGYEWFTEDVAPNNAVVEVYRAGFRDGRKPPEPRVFRDGDPEPGPEVDAVLDADGDVWTPHLDEWVCGATTALWPDIFADFGPLVACAPLPDFRAAVDADNEKRRAAAESAGGAQ